MEKLKRLKERRAPQSSISWVERQIKYLKDGKFIGPTITKYYRVTKPVITYQTSKAHDVAMQIFEEIRPRLMPSLPVIQTEAIVSVSINTEVLSNSFGQGFHDQRLKLELLDHIMHEKFPWKISYIRQDRYIPYDPGGPKPTDIPVAKSQNRIGMG